MPRQSWLIAFSDLAALLTGLFVLTLSMSEFDTTKLEDIAASLGRNEGEWQHVMPADTDPNVALLRTLEDPEAASAYLAAVLTRRARDEGWPFRVAREGSTVALIVADDTALPAGLAQHLGQVRYRLTVRAVFPETAAARAEDFGVFDVGLERAAKLADALVAAGAGRDVPVETRVERNIHDFRLEILVEQPVEIAR